MKTQHQIFVISSLIFMTMFLFSCNRNNVEECSSCVNSHNYVMEHKSLYENYSRKEWLSLPDSLKISVYSAMTPNNKYLFWKDKLEEVEKLNWSEAELAHIDTLKNFISSNKSIFEDGRFQDSVMADMIEDFVKDWLDYASEELGWSRSIQFCVAASGEVLTNNMLSALRNGLSVGNGVYISYCNCSTRDNWCLKTCHTDCKCVTEEDGCGFLFLYRCNGGCY